MAIARERLGRQFLISVVAVAALSVSVLAGFAAAAMWRVDAESLDRDRILLGEGIRDIVSETARDQRSVTTWNEAVLRVRADDVEWISIEMGEWLHSWFGMDASYVVAPDGRVVYAMEGGKSVDASRFSRLPDGAGRLLQEVRAQTSGSELPDKTGAGDVLFVDGRPASVTVQPILPNSTEVPRSPGKDFVHVAVKFVDGKVLDKTAGDYRIAGVGYVPVEVPLAPGVPSLDLASRDGTVLGRVTWQPDAPGRRMVVDTIPGLAFALAGIGIVLAILLRRVMRSAREIEVGRAQARHLATHDVLTGLPNRDFFNTRLDASVGSMRERSTPFSVLSLDLDRFKQVNDTLGHQAGDELIRQASTRIAGVVGASGVVARLGGDEFGVILGSGIDAGRIATEIVQVVSFPFDILGSTTTVGASVGVVRVTRPDGDRVEIFRRADVALYEAKKRGRGRSHEFDEEIDAGVRGKRALESDLAEAISTGEGLRLVYQPMYGRDGTTVVGAEALVRWDHPVLGTLQPDRFVGIADERGLSGALGRRILDEACRTAAATTVPWIAVNVSPLQMRSSGFADEVFATLARHGVDATRLQLEISESLLLDPTEETVAEIRRLRAAGIRMVIDDFGTDGSSIRYLTRYSLDKIKIDRSFVRNIAPGAGSSADIVRAIVGLAKAVGIDVAVEGIETEEQLGAFSDIDCGEMQGFLFSDAVDASELPGSGPAALRSMGERMRSATGSTEAVRGSGGRIPRRRP